jgi:hypothetical protein
MLSTHFWMGTGVTLGMAAVMGLGLGSFVTSPQAPVRSASATIDTAVDDQTAEEASFTTDKGPGAIHCTGCGPTLADRRWKADMAGLDMDAPIDAGYEPLAEEDATDAVIDPPVRVHPLPPQVARFASGDGPPSPAAMTRERQDAAAPPQIILPAAAESILPQ